MSTVKKTFAWFIVILFVLNLVIILSENTHLYKGIANTYLKGKKGASIDEYQIFHNREVKSGIHQPWPIGNDYNTQKIPSALLETLEELGTIAYLIIVNDSIRLEQYWDGYNENSHTNAFSMAKSIVSILIGIAIDEGKIKSVDQKVGDFLASYNEGEKATISIKHLLTMSSGLNFDESYSNPFAFPAKAYFGDDLRALIEGYDVVESPGLKFEYLSGNTQLLGFVLEKATGEKIADYAAKKLWGPIGAKYSAFWSLDKEGGNEKAYCCFNSNARDFARIGQLYLNNGVWKGKQLISSDYVKASVKAADLVEKDDGTKLKRYGYSWWMTDYRGDHIFLMEGLMGQYVAVIPSKSAIMVRLGKNKMAKEKVHRLPKDLFLYIDHVLDQY
ncbi:MAG TPA: class C beta-lactamase-related serine hydrolase [Flavobacteriales bacterium]|nr:class C beta-lactamase-related serine hydrolase [Flavobacteriales bacterium]HIN40286.1 class C beta-lactamase-related serine hydrolase [Flavobacteriales bacterium]